MKRLSSTVDQQLRATEAQRHGVSTHQQQHEGASNDLASKAPAQSFFIFVSTQELLLLLGTAQD